MFRERLPRNSSAAKSAGIPKSRSTWCARRWNLAAGSSHVRIQLNPNDLKAMGDQMRVLIDEIAPLSGAELNADPEITPGGCRVETRFGIIDQQFESQLKRIEEELTQ